MERILKSKYKILDKIAENSYAITYKGELIETNAPLVIKIFKRNFLNSPLIKVLKKNIPALSRLSYPSIPRLIDGDYGWQGFYFIREFVDGKTLGETSTPMETEDAIKTAIGICEAVSFAHSQNIIHGNLTVNNVFIDPGGSAKIADFGIFSTVYGSFEKKAELFFYDGAAYLSPEEILGEKATISSDIYRIGLILYKMITGALPYKNGNALFSSMKKIKESPEAPSRINQKVPKYLDDIILKCLDPEQMLRFESADVLKVCLENRSVPPKQKQEVEIQNIDYIIEKEVKEKEEEKEKREDEIAANEEEPGEKINLVKWIILAVLVAASTGIIYALIQMILSGE